VSCVDLPSLGDPRLPVERLDVFFLRMRVVQLTRALRSGSLLKESPIGLWCFGGASDSIDIMLDDVFGRIYIDESGIHLSSSIRQLIRYSCIRSASCKEMQ